MGSCARLKQRMRADAPLILDGGLATELEAQGVNLSGDPLWSARLLHTNPQAIRDAHYSFLLSGSDVVTTATYQASIRGFISYLDLSPEGARELLMSGVRLAAETVERLVRDGHPAGLRGPLVAASVGPYGAFLHDGSEYTGAYAQQMSVEELKDWHRPQVDCLAAAGADLLAFETIPSIKEAQAVAELLREFPNCAAWLAFSCKDGRCISDGTPFTEAVRVASRSLQLLAVGANCCPPALVEPLLDSAAALRSPDLSWVVYPNSGEEWDHQRGWLDGGRSATRAAELSRTWLRQGAALIGGCCRMRPADIAEIRQRLKGGPDTSDTSSS